MSTRRASPGIPFRQERFASAEAYRSSLNGLLVAKRCSLLGRDPELRELVWMIQEQSLADHYNVGGRAGSIDHVADALLQLAGFSPEETTKWVEDFTNGHSYEEVQDDGREVYERTRSDLVSALCNLALNPAESPPNAMPGLGAGWRGILIAYREQLRATARQTIAATSVTKAVVEALRFTKETNMPSLTEGVARLGKSAGAKAFCAASGGLARYVLTPEDDQMGSFHRSIAKALGVADALSKKDSEVRELVEKTLQTSRLMLVFDEAHNLFSGCRRLRRDPVRILWLRRMVDSGVPVAFVALPDFRKRVARYADQLDWDTAQITDIIAKGVELPRELSAADFELLVGRIASDLSTKSKSLIASTANGQRGAQYVVDVIRVAKHVAEKAGRATPSDSDVAEAVGNRPVFKLAPEPVAKRGVRPAARSVAEPHAPKVPLSPPMRDHGLALGGSPQQRSHEVSLG